MRLADFIKTGLPYFPNWITVPLMKLNFWGKWCYGKAYVNYGKIVCNTSPEQKLLGIVNYAIKHVPYYRNLYRNITINSIRDFEEKIGFIDKDIVMSNWEQFISDEVDWSKVYTGTTGGTSGKPMKIMMPKNRYVFSLYFTHQQYKKFGWDYNIIGVIRNNKLPETRDYICNPIMRQIIFDAFRGGDEYYKKVWTILKKYNIKFIHAYPSAAYSLLKSCYNQNIDVSFIKVLFLSSEAITDSQYYFFKEVLNLQIAGEYGHSEKLCRASNLPNDCRYHIDKYYGYTEVIDKDSVIKEKGAFGQITGTTFMNYSFPLIRYKTGDYAFISEYEPNLILNSIEGRWDNSIIYKMNDTQITATALNLHSDIYEHIDGLQYIQEKKGYIIVNVIPSKNFTEEDYKYLKDHTAMAMGGEQYVTIRCVDKLNFFKNGKFLPVISRI